MIGRPRPKPRPNPNANDGVLSFGNGSAGERAAGGGRKVSLLSVEGPEDALMRVDAEAVDMTLLLGNVAKGALTD
jgi:hypothetical protein